MEVNKPDKLYTAEDIQKYISGKMPSAEMHSMEKAALNDPFLAEAMEGFLESKDPHLAQHLLLLRERITKRSEKTGVLILSPTIGKWWKTVAAILILSTITGIAFLLLRNKTTRTPDILIAQKQPVRNEVENKTQLLDTTPATITNTHTPTSQEEVRLASKPARQTPGYNNISNNQLSVKSDSQSVYQSDKTSLSTAKVNTPPLSKDKVADNAKSPASNSYDNSRPPFIQKNNAGASNEVVLTENGRVLNANTILKRETINTTRDKKDQKTIRNFIAQVVGPDNLPLPFANISIQNENFGTYADVNGYFRLVSTDTLLNIQVKSVGYLPRNFILGSNIQQNKIVLAEDAIAVKEKTIISLNKTAFGIKTRHAMLLKDTLSNVAPADGWDNYNTYVANNIAIPDEILKNNLHGEVELSFEVKKNGSISNIKVDKSLCEDCDEATKHLLEQGPQWKVKSGKKGRVRLRVQF